MAETRDPEEPTLPSKRKPDPSCEDNAGHPNKTQKLQNPNYNSQLSEDKIQNPDNKENNNDASAAAEDRDEDDDENVDSNGEAAEVDRKGKGILLEGDDESDDDDDDDSSDGGSQSEGDSDLSDDPLAEVDLDNILPSRTRRKVIQPGEYIANDLVGDDDDSDSDDGDT